MYISVSASGGLNNYWYVLHLNPEPWAVGTVAYNRVSPNLTLKAFQEAVREELCDEEPLPSGEYRLRFFLWRQQAKYLDDKDRVKHRNQADATNMQKALEDALQGILFDNDRNVRHIGSVIMAQGPEVEPCIVICASNFVQDIEVPGLLLKLPGPVFRQTTQGPVQPLSDNVWRGPNK